MPIIFEKVDWVFKLKSSYLFTGNFVLFSFDPAQDVWTRYAFWNLVGFKRIVFVENIMTVAENGNYGSPYFNGPFYTEIVFVYENFLRKRNLLQNYNF